MTSRMLGIEDFVNSSHVLLTDKSTLLHQSGPQIQTPDALKINHAFVFYKQWKKHDSQYEKNEERMRFI